MIKLRTWSNEVEGLKLITPVTLRLASERNFIIGVGYGYKKIFLEVVSKNVSFHVKGSVFGIAVSFIKLLYSYSLRERWSHWL